MTYSLAWAGDDQILYCRLWNSLSVTDLRAANHEIDSQLVSRASAVHLVFHVLRVDHRLPSVNALRGPLTTQGYDRVHWTVFVGGNAAARFIGSVIVSSLGLRVHAAESIADAALFLGQADPSLSFEALAHLVALSSGTSELAPANRTLPSH